MATAVVDDYLGRLDRALVGPARVKRGLLDEAVDHLAEAEDAFRRAGCDEREAAERAVADFGPVDEVASAFQTALAVAASRRTALALLAFLLPQPLLWDGGLHLAGTIESAKSDSLAVGIIDTILESFGMLAMIGAVLAVIATGIGNRWFHAGRQVAQATAWLTLLTCLLVPTLAGTLAVLTGQQTQPMHLVVMVGLVLLPLALIARSARRCLAATASPA